MNLYQEVALSFKKVGDPCSRDAVLVDFIIFIALFWSLMRG